MKRIYLLLSLLAGCLFMQAAIYNVRDFGAKADGKTIDSPAINRAIEAAAPKTRKKHCCLLGNLRKTVTFRIAESHRFLLCCAVIVHYTDG